MAASATEGLRFEDARGKAVLVVRGLAFAADSRWFRATRVTRSGLRLTRYTVKCSAKGAAEASEVRLGTPVGFACAEVSGDATTSGGPCPSLK